MSDTPTQGTTPLWSDEAIGNDAKRADSSPTVQEKIRSCLLFMRHGYEADRQRLIAEADQLRTELVEALKRIQRPEEGGEQDSREYVSSVERTLREWDEKK